MKRTSCGIAMLVGTALLLAGCSGDPEPDRLDQVTFMEEVGPSNQGKALKETFRELDLQVEWAGATKDSPPEDDHIGAVTGLVTDEEGTRTEFFVQLPQRNWPLDPPDQNPLIRGSLLQGDLLGGIGLLLGTHRSPGGPEFTEAEWNRKDELAILVVEGLCRKFAGRECGDPEPYRPEDI